MKKMILAVAILVSGIAINNKAEAQISVNLNIGSQPDWGPVGYDYVDYYYMPDIDAYYSVPTHEYIYYSNNRWARSRSLPSRFSNFNPYNSYKVVINEPNPWERAGVYRSRYAGYRGRHDQVIIRNSKDVKYKNHYVPGRRTVVYKTKGNGKAKGHWKGNGPGHGKGPGKGHGKGHGKH
ncbi:hypothetical protein [Mucilaginibacter aquatilis]|uniref:Uncharacterized protein n=1 Tax=Mucilaginibacter aquatilis TaxID=1517760 RepID=A0A6I4I5M6_9SPHI|nr:hypothetical protein [Mucilaginibacter aquatilis]MVN90420.1 hypothetical protein [Mucilaginibacter aquatilis]